MVRLDAPTVSIDPMVHSKIMYWVQKSPVEISGLGKVKLVGGVYRIVDAILLEQENSATETEIDAKAIAKAMYETKDSDGTLNFWWHSHVDMGTFWSGTDHDTMHQLGKNGWFVSSVFNKKGSIRSAYYQGGVNGYPSLFVDGIKTVINAAIPKKIENEWEKEYKDKCVETVYSYVGNKSWRDDFMNSNGNWQDTNGDGFKLTKEEQLEVLAEHDFSQHDTNLSGIKDYQELTVAEKETWFQFFVDSYGENPAEDTELEEFYYTMFGDIYEK